MEQNNLPASAETGKKPFLYTRHILLGVLCLVLAAGVVLSALWLGKPEIFFGKTGKSSASSFYDFEATTPSDYIDGFTLDLLKGHIVPGKGHETKTVDDAYLNDYFRSVLLLSRKADNDGKVNRTSAVDYADKVYAYFLSIEDENGKRLLDDYFGARYSQTEFSVGGRYFGKDFDEKVTGLVPNDYAITFRRSGSFTGNDILSVNYTAKMKIDGEDMTSTLSSARIVLAEKDAAFREALLGACTEVGKQFTFRVTEDYDRDGETEEVEYTMTVTAVVTETAARITFAVPVDFYDASSDEKLLALNGKEITLSLIPTYSVAYTAYTPESILSERLAEDKEGQSEADRIKAEKEATAELLYCYDGSGYSKYSGTIKLDEVADKETLVKNFLDYQKSLFEESVKASRESAELNLIADAVLESLKFRNFSETEVARFYYTFSMQQYVKAYLQSNAGTGFDSYLSVMGVLDGTGSAAEQIRENTEFLAKQQLLIAWIYNNALKDGEKEAKVRKNYYEQYLSSLLVAYGYETQENVTAWKEKGILEKKLASGEKKFEKAQGVEAGTLYKDYHLKAVTDYVYDWLIANNTVDYTVAAPEK